jgi:GT2 family glycosyltransferase
MNKQTFTIVSGTRKSETVFWAQTALGKSLPRLCGLENVEIKIFFNNTRGLSVIYNETIQTSTSEYIIFVHDDVWLDDYFLIKRVEEGLNYFDIIGLAGNRRRLPKQPSWYFTNERFIPDSTKYLSGAVGHGANPAGAVSYYNHSPASCELLDGLFLATKIDTLKNNGVFFDPQFEFHFYDMDFCRSARQASLHIGTWPIAVTHQSGGAFGLGQWQELYQQYLDKWID